MCATKYILNLPFSTDIEYKTRLQSLNLLPLCYWHEYLDLILFFKITKGLVFSRLRPQPVSSSRRITRSTSNSVKYIVPRSKTTTYQKSFLIRSCRTWNILADDLNLNIDISLYSLKTILHDYYFAALDINYNPEYPKTFKTVCLKSTTFNFHVHDFKQERLTPSFAIYNDATYFRLPSALSNNMKT